MAALRVVVVVVPGIYWHLLPNWNVINKIITTEFDGGVGIDQACMHACTRSLTVYVWQPGDVATKREARGF